MTLEVGETHGVIAELENKEDQIGIGVAGDLIINVKGDDTDKTGDGINVSNTNLGSINITAGNSNFIKATSAHGDGIKVESGKTLSDAAEIKLTASLGNNVISSGNNGIDHGGAQMILLDAKNGINKITTIAKKSASENKEMTGDGIRIGTAEKEHALPNGKVVLEAQSNIIDAEDAGLNNSGSKQAEIDVTATVGPNIISGEKEAVLLNGSGSIIVKAQNDNSGISLLTEIVDDDYYNKHTNIFGGGENGIHAAADSDGNFTAIADENNYISGSVNGIWTEESSGTGPIISIDAGQDNIIGFTGKVSDSGGEILEGTIGQKGINVSSGSVTLTAGKENKIKAIKSGVLTSGEKSRIELNAQTNTIEVINHDIGIDASAIGIKASNKGIVNIGTNDKYTNKTVINTNTVRGNSVGLWADNGTINFTGNELVINSSNNDTADAYAQVVGIMAGDITYNEGEVKSNISIKANKNITILSNSSSTHADAYGLKITQDSYVNFNSVSGNILVTSINASLKKDNSTLYGIAVYDSGEIKSEANSLLINSGINGFANGVSSYGVLLVGDDKLDTKEDVAKANFSIINDISINSFARGGDNLDSPNIISGIEVTGCAQAELISKEGDININVEGGYVDTYSSAFALSSEGQYASIGLSADKNISITSNGYQSFAINLNNNSDISLNNNGHTLIHTIAHNF